MHVKTVISDFDTKLKNHRELVNKLLRDLLAEQEQMQDCLKEAVGYVLEAPGKRIRAAMVLFCCEVVAGDINKDAEIAAAAIEMVHSYSLVHDDLPAMDDDDLRRGRATCHKAFDEATAILAGDALLTLAFEIISKKVEDPQVAIHLIRDLAESAGASGMITGQMADLKAEKVHGDKELLLYIHTNKTAKMFRCAAAAGAIAAGADKNQYELLCEYGLKVGLGFQIADDILDVSSSSEQLGKTAGKDEKAGKFTYPALFGLEKSKELQTKIAEDAIKAIESFGPEADTLRRLAVVMVKRTK